MLPSDCPDHQPVSNVQEMVIRDIKRSRDQGEIDGQTRYGLRLLSQMFTKFRPSGGDVEPFDEETSFPCANLSGKLYKVDTSQWDEYGANSRQLGFGRDKLAWQYLKDVLEKIKSFNETEHCPLEPLVASGDGRCLVHAVSRCLTGRELFWHPLMDAMRHDLIDKRDIYRLQLDSFCSTSDIDQCIEEADPDYMPSDGKELGLADLHIFALANVLRRPIFLFDGECAVQAESHFASLFLPVFVEIGIDNEPIFIAWSSRARNHFVPLICRKDIDSFCLPKNMIPPIWGSFNVDYSRSAYGNGKEIKDKFWETVVPLMEKKFMDLHGISVYVVADYYQKAVLPSNLYSLTNIKVIEEAKEAVAERALLECLSCGALAYRLQHDLIALLDALLNPAKCEECQFGDLRALKENGDLEYENLDWVKTFDSCEVNDKQKVFWDKQLYDNAPMSIEIKIPNEDEEQTIFWFYKESDKTLNSNAYKVAERIVNENYQRRHQHKSEIVDEILKKTAHLVKGSVTLTEGHENSGATNVVKKRNSQGRGRRYDELSSQTAAEWATMERPKRLSQACNVREKPQIEASSILPPATAAVDKICISYSGKKVHVDIVEGMTYGRLQKLVEDIFGIPKEKQVLKHGFPRKTISPQSEDDKLLCLKNGDAVLVDQCVLSAEKLSAEKMSAERGDTL